MLGASRGRLCDSSAFLFYKTYSYIPKLIMFHTHNLQIFKHNNTLINKLLLMQFLPRDATQSAVMRL